MLAAFSFAGIVDGWKYSYINMNMRMIDARGDAVMKMIMMAFSLFVNITSVIMSSYFYLLSIHTVQY